MRALEAVIESTPATSGDWAPTSATVIRSVLEIKTRQNFEFIDLTARVVQEVNDSGIEEGTVFVQSHHTTAAIVLNEWQDALLDDLRALVERAVPAGTPWRHNDPRYSDCTRGNAVSHLRAMLLGPGVTLPVTGGRISRGTWQSIILAEMDGPRQCSVSVQVVGFGAGTAMTKTPRTATITMPTPSVGPRTSEFWEERFRGSRDNPPDVPWDGAAQLTDTERDRIRASIQEFQLGEQSEGRHLKRAAIEYSARSGDAAYSRAMNLFIREEQNHAALLGRYMDLAGIPRVRRTWVDSVFRLLRKFAGLEMSICVLLTAEMIAKVYYASLREATGCPALRAICTRILEDEAGHVEFQSERLAILRRGRSRWQVTLAETLQRILFAATVPIVWLGHAPVLRSDNATFAVYWRRCHCEFRRALAS